MSIRMETPENGSSLWSTRGLVKIPSEVTPSPSSNSLYAPVHVYVQKSPSLGSNPNLAAPLSDNPESRNHSEVGLWKVKYKVPKSVFKKK